MIVVELGLALLAAIGLTRLSADLQRRMGAASRAPMAIAAALCFGTLVDISVHQPRQNPIVPADAWLAPPLSAEWIRRDSTQPRTFTPEHRNQHRLGFVLAQGWSNLAPYLELRDALEPNTGGGYWNVPSADCYAGIAPRWHVDVWGDHNRDGLLVSKLTRFDFERRIVTVDAALPNVLRTFGVTHLLSVYPLEGANLVVAGREGAAYLYRLEGAARVRFVSAARRVESDEEAVSRLTDVSFDPDREVLLLDAPRTAAATAPHIERRADVARGTRPVITAENSRELVIEADAPSDGFLLLADSFYPGWIAELDDKTVPVYRANVSVRAIDLPAGRHRIRFVYRASEFFLGLRITLAAVSILIVWLAAAVFFGRRHP